MSVMPRGTMFFESGRYGWSETHWYQSQSASLTQVQADLDILAKKRAWLLGAGATLTYCRVSYDDTFRDSLLDDGPVPTIAANGIPYYNPALESLYADSPFISVLLRAEGTALYRKQIYLGACPQGSEELPVFGLGPAWLSAFNLYSKALQALWGFKVQSKDPVAAPRIAVSNATFAGGVATLTLASSIPGGFTPPFKLRVSQLKATPNFVPGVYTVASYALPPGTGTVVLREQVASTVYDGGGIVHPITYTVVPYTNLIPIGVTHRKRGVGYDPPRGRAKRRQSV